MTRWRRPPPTGFCSSETQFLANITKKIIITETEAMQNTGITSKPFLEYTHGSTVP